ncbi:MAG: RagB/SusD family nutrient uptake outer membrane protein [Salinivirgaceae bacterium]|jgi:hypothetical protein|nr:RagB/SusD family nutrient uptake outer membrane protein [Salinivirgaceae bacterium]
MMKLFTHLFSIKATIVLAIILIFQTSCNKWIDIEPENDLIQQEFWKTQDDVLAVLAATYNATRSNSFIAFSHGEIRADFITIPSGDLGWPAIAGNKVTATSGETGWGGYYKAINLANTVMHYAPIVKGYDQTLTDEVLDGINSEMLFLRSLAYFYLVRTWKEVPLILSATISDTVDFYIPKSPEHVILKQLVKDLKEASSLASTKFSDQGRVNKYGIQALLADVLLWSENYDECITYCDAIINSGHFTLEDNSNWFRNYYPGNSPNESIFEVLYDDNLEGQSSDFISYDELNVEIDKMAYEETTDIRICGGSGPLWKYIGLDETGKNSKRRRSGLYDASFIYYRYSEILLMKAECLAETGNFADANKLLSDVAERAGTIHLETNTLESFRTALLAERGREFAAEGKRWFDVLRFAKRNKFEGQSFLANLLLDKAADAQDLAIMRARVLDTMSFYLPISDDEIKLNRNLVQNPFYDK